MADRSEGSPAPRLVELPLIDVGEPFTISDEDVDLLLDAIRRAIEHANRAMPSPDPDRRPS